MSTYAVIEDGVVINTIVAESQEIAEEHTGKVCVEYTVEKPALIGWTYDGTTFTNPVPFVFANPEK
jgi:hypothetical protein